MRSKRTLTALPIAFFFLLALLGLMYWLFPLGGYAYCVTGPGYTAVIGTGGVTYEVPGPSLPGPTYTADSHLYWRTNRWTLKVNDDGHVWQNGVSYGSVSQRDKLKMTWEGAMFVNGVQRYPDGHPLEPAQNP
jgi:hypothetical protein